MKFDITQVRKDFIYDVYERIVDDPKDYEKITRKLMIKKIFEYYKQDNHLELCLTYQDIIDLKEIINNGNKTKKHYHHLYELLLLDFSDPETLHFDCINTDILPFIKEHIYTYDLEKVKQREESNQFIIGMIRSYGIINLNNFEQYLHLYNEIYKKKIDIEHDVLQNRFLREYYCIRQDGNDYFIVFKVFDSYFDNIYDFQQEENFEIKMFDEQTLINIGKYGFDISKKSLNDLYRELLVNENKELRDILYVMLNMQYDFEDIKNYFMNNIYFRSYVKDDLLKCIKNAIDDIPLAIYYGKTTDEYCQDQDQAFQNYVYLESQKQGNAHLESKDARSFYKMYMGLLDYVNQKYQIVKESDFDIAYHVNPMDQVKIREKLFEDLSIIDEFIQKNPNHFNKMMLKQVKEVKNAVKVRGMIVKFERNYTIFIDENDIVYGIIGANSNLDEIIDKNHLPHMCQLVLVPYKNKIIYDGVIEGIGVKMGPGIQSNIVKTLKDSYVYKSLPIKN